MRQAVIALLLGGLVAPFVLGGSAAFAALTSDELQCRATRWPFKSVTEDQVIPVAERRELMRQLRKIPRQFVNEYFVAEVTAQVPRRNLARFLGDYLRGTAKARKWQLFFELVMKQAGLTPSDDPRPLKLKELCDGFESVRKGQYRFEE